MRGSGLKDAFRCASATLAAAARAFGDSLVIAGAAAFIIRARRGGGAIVFFNERPCQLFLGHNDHPHALWALRPIGPRDLRPRRYKIPPVLSTASSSRELFRPLKRIDAGLKPRSIAQGFPDAIRSGA